MAPKRWTRYFALFASTLGALAVSDPPTRACGFFGPFPDDFMTFDQSVTGDDGLGFDPMVIGLGGPCAECGGNAMLEDWHGYFKGAVPDVDWKTVLLSDNPNDVIAARGMLAKKGDRVKDALAFVELARKVEPFASASSDTRPPGSLLTEAQAAMKAAREPFLVQRYAFQVLRITFYERDWAAAVAFYDKNAAVLSTPSTDLAWRARYYMAGAAKRGGNRARANLELARISAGYEPLASVAAEDFKPMEDTDWKDSLRLAKDVRDKTLLWRLVGIRTDGMVALQEIMKLDPKSDLIALLLVRELARAEPLGEPVWDNKPDAKEIAARDKAFADLEKIATKIITTPGADRPWIAQLVRGHIAALRGDVAIARRCLDKAVAGAPGDRRVANQAKASLAIALARSFKIDPARETEIANTMAAVDRNTFRRSGELDLEVHTKLAQAYNQAGRFVDAEFLKAGTVDPKKWRDRKFIEAMIARSEQAATAFDKLVITGAFTRAQLDTELATRELYEGDFAAAAQMFQAKAHSEQLHVDPFVSHVIDCHDCDQEKYKNAKWTHASLANRLVELERAASGQGEQAAKAALDIGDAMYNVTWFGNTRVFAENTHQRSADTAQAEKWLKRAFDLSKSRELKAKAAWQAAKSELGRLESLDVDEPWGVHGQNVPMPKKWFGVMKQFADTKYYKEALAECSRFRTFLGQ
jgi:hypothetical protein